MSEKSVKQKHFILTNGRSGSNYLTGLINSHPNAVNYGEVLGDWTLPAKLYRLIHMRPPETERYVLSILSNRLFFSVAQNYSALSRGARMQPLNIKRWSNVQTVGVKDFSTLIVRRGLGDFFQNNPDVKVISLIRKNTLKRYISLKSMQETGIVKVFKDGQARRKIRLDINRLIDDLERLDGEYCAQKALSDSIPEHRVLRLDYEKLFSSEESVRKSSIDVLGFLDLKNHPVESLHKKINKGSIRDSIENYEEVHEVVINTRFGKFLYDV